MAIIMRLAEKLVYSEEENPWVQIYFDSVRFPNGIEGRYNRIVESGGRPGVAVMPIRANKVCLVRQYRYPVGQYLWEIPRGFGESKEPREDAVRELAEETGIKAANFIEGGYLCPNSGLLESKVALFFAIVENYEADRSNSEEVESTKWVEISDLWKMVEDGKILDCFTLSALAIATAKGLV